MGEYGIWPLVAFATLYVALVSLLAIERTARHTFAVVVGIALSLASVAAATLGPGGRINDSKLRLDPTAHLDGLQVVGNLILFVPFGGFLALLRVSWITALALAVVLSGAIETVQYLAIEGRYAATSDLILNTLGAILGYIAFARAPSRRGS